MRACQAPPSLLSLAAGGGSLKLHWGWRRRAAYHTDAAARAAAAPASALNGPLAAQISWTCRPAGEGGGEQHRSEQPELHASMQTEVDARAGAREGGEGQAADRLPDCLAEEPLLLNSSCLCCHWCRGPAAVLRHCSGLAAIARAQLPQCGCLNIADATAATLQLIFRSSTAANLARNRWLQTPKHRRLPAAWCTAFIRPRPPSPPAAPLASGCCCIRLLAALAAYAGCTCRRQPAHRHGTPGGALQPPPRPAATPPPLPRPAALTRGQRLLQLVSLVSIRHAQRVQVTAAADLRQKQQRQAQGGISTGNRRHCARTLGSKRKLGSSRGASTVLLSTSEIHSMRCRSRQPKPGCMHALCTASHREPLAGPQRAP